MSIDAKQNFKIGDVITLNEETILDKIGLLPYWYTDENFHVVGFERDCIILNKKLPHGDMLTNPYLINCIFAKKDIKNERKEK